MASSRKPVTPDQRIRDLRKEFKALEKEEPGPQRAPRLAEVARTAHADRQLNMAMHAAELCLAEDPNPPELLVAAYRIDADGEEHLQALADLRDLARYVDRPDVVEIADHHLESAARAWVVAGDEGERRYRLRSVQSLTSRELADRLRDELR